MGSFFGRKSKPEPEMYSSGRKGTKITIRFNTGFKNNLFIRGKGAGLSWDHGVQLKNVGPDEWIWETNMPFNDLEFKVLINDKQYEAGENHHVHEGATLQYTPRF